MVEDEQFGWVLEHFRVVWVVEPLQDGTWTARYCWRPGIDHDASRALHDDVLNGKSRRLRGVYTTETETVTAIQQAILLEARWSRR